jgi:hypothetical protein
MIALLLLSFSSLVSAQFALSDTLGNHMVLQRGQKGALVWGFDAAGATVKTVFQGTQYTSTAGSDGIWRQRLPPTAAGGPYNIIFSSSTGGAAALDDVLFGDVYICGGQVSRVALAALARLHAAVPAFYATTSPLPSTSLLCLFRSPTCNFLSPL